LPNKRVGEKGEFEKQGAGFGFCLGSRSKKKKSRTLVNFEFDQSCRETGGFRERKNEGRLDG